ncbi:MAG TPA: CHAT domain-containing tetratricopeptide repeat protein [Gemmatimonadaceae bacterium]
MKRGVAVAILAISFACRGERTETANPAIVNAAAQPSRPYPSKDALSRAESLYFAAEYDSAAKIWRETLATDSVRSDSAAQAHILMWLGMREWRLGNYDSARVIGERSLALKIRLGRTRELSRSYNSLGLIARDEGRLIESRDLFAKAIETARTVGDTAGINRGAINLALVQQDLGEFTEAQKGFETARDAGRAMGDARLEGNALNNLGALLIRMGDPAAAIPLLHDAVARYGSIEYHTGLQNTMGQLATAYDALGNPQQAFALLDSASRMARAQGLKQEEQNNLRLFGELYQEIGDHQRALGYLARARALSIELGLDRETAVVLRAEARSQLAVGRADIAADRLEDALKMNRAQKASFDEMTNLLAMSELAERSGDSRLARLHLDGAKAIAGRINSRSARAEIALSEARLARRSNDWRRVIEVLAPVDRDIRSARASGTWEAHALRARAYAGLNKLDSAVAAGRLAVAAADRVRGNIAPGALRTSFASERSSIYAELAVVLLRLNRTDEAFEVADAARGRAMLEHLSEARRDLSERGATRDLAEGERLLRQIDQLTSLLREADRVPQRERAAADEERMGAMAERLASIESEYEGLMSRTVRENREHAGLMGAAGTRAASVSRALSRDEALVEYLVTPSKVLAFVVRRDGIRSHSIPVTESELAGRVRIARGLAAKVHALDSRDLSVFRGLHAILVAPLATSLHGVNRIVVVPHSTLSYLPFAALLDERQNYLSDRYAILYAASAGSLVSMRARSEVETVSRRTVVLAPFPVALPSTRREANDIRAAVRSSRVLLGASASEPALRDALRQSSMVHVASHAVLNARNPLFSRIELARPATESAEASANDGRLDVHELFGMRVASRLVFLSGCETGLGTAWSTDFARGEDYATLAQAFLYAGAGTVVATLWRIDDEAAAVFASRFYRNLKRMPPAEALAAAQKEVRRDARFAAPYNWAAYTLSGNAKRVNAESSRWNPFD